MKFLKRSFPVPFKQKMLNPRWSKQTARRSLFTMVIAFGLLLVACDQKKSNMVTVGTLNILPELNPSLLGFKEGMEELGYSEGKTIRYIYDGPTTDMKKLANAAHSLLTKDIDLILSITTPATLAVKQASAGNELPVVFSVVTDPLGAGIVKSMQHPGGHITGVAFGVQEARRLEWITRVAPAIKKIYIPYNPNDKSPVLALRTIRSSAAKLGVELITREIHDQAMLDEVFSTFPTEADAVFFLPDSLIGTRTNEMLEKAIKLNLPTSVANISAIKDSHALMAFGCDLHLSGKQAARLADQIIKGAKPADLPVELAEPFLAINLKVAKAIGLTIPNEILRHAHVILH